MTVVTLKTCTKCGLDKPVSSYSKAKMGKHGVQSQCKDCMSQIAALRWRLGEGWRDTDFGRMVLGRVPSVGEVASVRTCTSCGCEKPLTEYYPCKRGKFGVKPTCMVCERTAAVSRRASDMEAARAYGRAYYAANREKLLKAANDNLSTPRNRIDNAISSGMQRGIRQGSKNGRTSFSLVGYTLEELMTHLERQFEPWMTWDNYGFYGWHIDHIRPLSSFSYETPEDEDFKLAWALSNLQPLGAVDNWRKGSSYNADNDNGETTHTEGEGRGDGPRQA